MKIEVRFRCIEASNALREYVVRRIQFLLNRFSAGIETVVVRIGDINGPRGGVDKRCHVAIRGPALAPVTVQELSADVHAAIALAVERAARSVARHTARARMARNGLGLGKAS